VEADTFDAQTRDALVKFRCTVAGTHRAQIRKQRAVPRQIPENFRHFIIETHDGNGAGLFSRETDDVMFPINVFSFEARQIGLRRAQVPRQFIERLAFGIQFAGDDGLMFLPGDGPLVLELNFRPPIRAFILRLHPLKLLNHE
jgi:hypothetical protein